jgi:hypothetical protein
MCIEADRLKPDVIISGGAIGADTLAKRYANERNIPMVEHLPDYAKFGRRAPLERNKLIIQDSDFVLAFRLGTAEQSRGTTHAVGLAMKSGKPTRLLVV